MPYCQPIASLNTPPRLQNSFRMLASLLPVISVVVPIRDERGNIEPLVVAVHRVLEGCEFEMVCVDDGSVDGTSDTLQSLKRRFSRVRVVRHERSQGQSAAIVSGVRTARGEWVVTLDGDGQNDPGDIPALLLSVERACPTPSLVVGWRKNRRDPWVKRMSSKLANIAYRWLIGGVTPDVGCGIKLFRRDVFLDLPHFDHMHRFLPVLVRMRGGSVSSVKVRHRPRQTGRSKYGIHDRLWVGIIDLFGVRWLQRRALGATLRPGAVGSRSGQALARQGPHRRTAPFLLPGLGAAGAASYFDDEIVSSRFNSEMFEGGSLDKAFEAGEVLGSAAVQVGGAFATYGFGKLFSNPGVQELGRDLVRAQIVTQTLTQALKVAVRREKT